MGNINLPTPVALAGGALCLLAGYLVGTVAGPDTVNRTTAEVESYDSRSQELCLVGDAIADVPEAEDGRLCGLWRRNSRTLPKQGDRFRFVAIASEDGDNSSVYLYGDVVD